MGTVMVESVAPRWLGAALVFSLLGGLPGRVASADPVAAKPGRDAAATLVPFDTPESMRRLGRARHKADFFRLSNQFESQQNLGYCGPASAVIVLNALRIDRADVKKPRDESLFPAEYRDKLPPGLDPVFSRYTQGMFFDEQTQSVKTKAQFFGEPKKPGEKPSPGIELRELGEVLRAHGLAVDIRVVDEKQDERKMRAELRDNLGRAGDYVVINYFRPALGQTGGGHMSPVAAHDARSDSFLVMDVNPNRQPWVWVPAKLLFAAMRTPDVHENRGYLLIREGAR